MRSLVLSAFFSIFILSSCSDGLLRPADKKATRETVNLFKSMWELQQKGLMYGHQDDLMYGHTWWYEEGRSDVKDFTGDYPAIAGFELGHLELGDERSLDSVSFAQIPEQVRAHYKRGGIITMSWHANNPLTMQLPDSLQGSQGGTAWDVSSHEVVASILPGGENQQLFRTWLTRLATFFKGLKDDDGTPIPILFRPYHEHSGSFFWWGAGICTDRQYADLWRYTVHFLRDTMNIHNILYIYNTDRVTSLAQYMRGYPGDDVVDMMSFDMYDRGPQFGAELDSALNFVSHEAIARKKLTALSETGPRFGMADWWTSVLLPTMSKYPESYVLTWRDTYYTGSFLRRLGGTPRPAFSPDFLDFYKSPHTFFLKEIQHPNVYTRK